ncbi:DUF4265 domain-containing protein [Saccharopolyspora dendranthemae]|uniref:Uncharacterized protein DUF4265 n=1 Tax=Saccharopolyspora dendranthemae TaxID=1181886 RepID=A0A561U0M1_9PSEU|nr:DUF4265 domain-containing protein [Saccharopolyspora dendranthemae]TWF92913.1 uncharacterized protein DUF4265 [Saccharopolyspora dendranthemae]
MAPQLKVIFPLTPDDDGYPPVSAESLWAEQAGEEGVCTLQNTPFFAWNVSNGDRVHVAPDEQGATYVAVISRGGHTTVRLIELDDGEGFENLLAELVRAGCGVERSNLAGLVAVDVPPGVDLDLVRGLIQPGVDEGLWDAEESCIQHP